MVGYRAEFSLEEISPIQSEYHNKHFQSHPARSGREWAGLSDVGLGKARDTEDLHSKDSQHADDPGISNPSLAPFF